MAQAPPGQMENNCFQLYTLVWCKTTPPNRARRAQSKDDHFVRGPPRGQPPAEPEVRGGSLREGAYSELEWVGMSS